jgi:hypothetical protein
MASAGGCIEASTVVGREDDPPAWWIMSPYSDEDGRTCGSLRARGILLWDGAAFVLAEAVKSALA